MNHHILSILFIINCAFALAKSAAAQDRMRATLKSTPVTLVGRELSSVRYSYRDGLTVCLCDADNKCLSHIQPEDTSECRLCFRTKRDDSTIVESIETLSINLKGQPEQQIVQEFGVVQPSAVLRCGSRSCVVKTPVSIDLEQENPKIIVARGTVLLRDSDDPTPEKISFAQILRLEEDNPANPPSDNLNPNGKEQFETSGYAMITGVVILLPGMWGAAVYAYHRILRGSEDDDETEADIELGHDVDGSTEESMQPKQASINQHYEEEWETISCK